MVHSKSYLHLGGILLIGDIVQSILDKIKLNLKSIVYASKEYLDDNTAILEAGNFDSLEKKLLTGGSLSDNESKNLLACTNTHWAKDEQLISSAKRILEELGESEEAFNREKFNFVMNNLSKEGVELLCLAMFTILDFKHLFIYRDPKLISKASSSICELIYFAQKLEPQTFD